MIRTIGATMLAALLCTQPVFAWGALAVGDTGDVPRDGITAGWATKFQTREKAEEFAMTRCREQGMRPEAVEACKIVATFVGKCVAVAWDKEPHMPGWGWSVQDTKQAAEVAAREACKVRAGEERQKYCVLVASACDPDIQVSP